MLAVIESWLRWAGVVAGLGFLAVVLWRGVWQGLRHAPGRTTGLAGKILRAPLLLVVGFIWTGLLFFLWRPLPLALSLPARAGALALGALLYFAGLTLYLWGSRTLGEMYKPSTAFGVQLHAKQRLVTHGPYTFVRHPLYLGLQVAALGGLLVYRNWTFVFLLLSFAGLFLRARREEQALAAEFGERWEAYARRVPAWIPRLRRSRRSD
ncbi:MAG TPA: isoprenylcysteine carboxylmethyltransferase family protein [Anaerolineales bacterium]